MSPRIPPRSFSDYPFWLRFLLKRQKKEYGQTLEPSKIWGRSPSLFFGFGSFFAAISRKGSPINKTLQALLSVFVSQLNHCSFCIDANSTRVLSSGGQEGLLDDLEKAQEEGHFNNCSQLSEGEKAALSYAREVTLHNHVQDYCFEQLSQHYSEDEIIEITGIIAFQNASSKFNAALEIPAQGLCRRRKP